MQKKIISPEINKGQEANAYDVEYMIISIPTMNKIKFTLNNRFITRHRVKLVILMNIWGSDHDFILHQFEYYVSGDLGCHTRNNSL
jgi:hypothetical protein